MAMGRNLVRSVNIAHHHSRLCCLPSTSTIRPFQHLLSTRTEPEIEWSEAQKITLSVDLEASARQLLKFLAVIDRNRALYEGPQGCGDKFFINISQRCKHNLYHNLTKKMQKISSESGQKQMVKFQSEPTAELHFELMSSSSITISRNSAKIIGSSTMSLVNIVNAEQELSVDRWLELFPPLETKDTKQPLSLRVSLSLTPPASAPYVLHMAPSGGVENHTSVLDEAGNPVLKIHMR